MRLLQKIRQVRRNLLQCRKGFVYYQSSTQVLTLKDFDSHSSFQLRLLDREEIHSTHEWSGLQRPEIERRLEKGDQCYGYQLGDEIVYLHWISSGTNFVRGVDLLLTLNENEWYCYGVMTKPSARGQGLYKSAQRELIELAQKKGIQRLVAYVEAQNPIPQKIYQRLHYQVTPKITSYRILGIRFGNCYESTTGQVTHQNMNGAERRYNWI